MRRSTVSMVYLVLASFVLTALVASGPAFASKKGRRNTAWALSGATVYHLSKGHPKESLAFGAASAYAWSRTKESKRHHRKVYRPGSTGGATPTATTSATTAAGAGATTASQ